MAFLSFLHQGKSQMRERFWDSGKNYSERYYNPLEVYGFWLGASYRTLTQSVVGGQGEGSVGAPAAARAGRAAHRGATECMRRPPAELPQP